MDSAAGLIRRSRLKNPAATPIPARLRRTSAQLPMGARKILLCAERLYGAHGLDGVSLRQIIEAAGQANNSIVQHYFGSKQGLIQAVHDMRAPMLDAARQARLDQIDAQGGGGLQTYIFALHVPVLEIFSRNDRVNYAKFLQRLLTLGDASHPYFRSLALSPATAEIIERIKAHCPNVPPEVTAARLRLCSNLFMNAVIDFPRVMRPANRPFASEQLYWRDFFQILLAVFECPYPPSEARAPVIQILGSRQSD